MDSRRNQRDEAAFTNFLGVKRVFEKLCFRDRSFWTVGLTERDDAAFTNLLGLKRVFEKLCFCDRSVWTVGLTEEIKLRFQISPGDEITGISESIKCPMQSSVVAIQSEDHR